MDELFRRIEKLNNMHFPYWKDLPRVFYSNALAGEVGEYCNKIKKNMGGGSKQEKFTDEQLLEELADVFVYLSLAAQNLGYGSFGFEHAVHLKLDKVNKRMETKKKEV